MSSTLSYIKNKWAHAGFQKYFRNVGWSFAGQIFSLGMSFFIVAIVARYLGPEKYGVLNYALSFVSIFIFLASFGIDNILVRELLKYKEKKAEILNTAFSLKLLGGLLVIFTTFIFSFIFKNEPYITVLIFIYSLHLIFLSFNVVNSYFYSTVQHKFLFFAQVLSTLVVSILKLFFVYHNFGVGWFILSLVCETAISAFVLLWFFRKEGNTLRPSLDLVMAKNLLSDSWPFILSTAFYLIYTKIDQVMIAKMLDTTSLGIYAAGVKLAEIWYFIPAIICGVIFPAIANAKLTSEFLYRERLKKILVFIVLLSTMFAFLELLFAKYIVLFIFGYAYLGAVIILKIYTWAGVIVSCIIVIQQYLIVENKTRLGMFAFFVGALTNVVLNFIFIPKFGIVGSALATIVSYAIIPLTVLLKLKLDSTKNAQVN